MKLWKTLSRTLALDHSKWLQVENHTIQLPDGNILDQWPWVISPDFVNVLVQQEDGTFLIFRQTKYAVEGISLAPVGGYLEFGEDPLACAKREVREELGCEAAEWISFGRYPVDGNHGCGTAHIFFARSAKRVCNPIRDDLEEQEIVTMNVGELQSALFKGEFKVLSWATTVAMALQYLQQKK
ncbi:MAG TPA: NUDIX hydrolase [Bacteroidota bacterium]|nr:NUDIX hydrolase [Bacteroidota bacterium]